MHLSIQFSPRSTTSRDTWLRPRRTCHCMTISIDNGGDGVQYRKQYGVNSPLVSSPTWREQQLRVCNGNESGLEKREAILGKLHDWGIFSRQLGTSRSGLGASN